ncbi:MAG: hypothetical protein Q8M01_06590 [Rubrivivax sp.]|nr:hypothetical protein [Rubrivivax sp.]
MSNFDPLTLACEDWFATPLCELPDALRQRVEKEFAPMPWDHLSAEQRRSVALQLDYQHDPATEKAREDWWVFFNRMSALEAELAREGASDRVNLDELLDGSGRLKNIRDQIRRMKARERHAKDNYYPQRRVPVPELAPGKYMAYPKALHHLRERLGSTPEELAAWVWLGPDTGGLAAYLNVNELDPPPRFNFGVLPLFGTAGEEDADYVAPLMGCWFSSDDVANFQPADRFITGKVLIERWSSIPGLKVEPFIRAKIQESRLLDLHPIYGGTQAGSSNADHLPPMTEGLFRLADVEEIEAEDFGDLPDLGSDANPPEAATEAAPTPEPRTWQTEFLSLANLAPEEIRIALVGDTAEAGLAGNNMLEVSARDVTKRIPLASLGLTDRRSGSLNSQGAILVGMAGGMKLAASNENSAKITRLRKVFRSCFGVQDPVFPYNDTDGWAPRFQIVDRRGASADRARLDAESKTVSLDQLLDGGARGVAGSLIAEDDSEAKGDAADQWLRENDPKAKC